MKLLKIFLVLYFFSYILDCNAQNFNFQRTWATYYGDENLFIKANAIDSQGNIYIVGRATQINSDALDIATPNAHQQTYGGGSSDGFIVKFSQDGIVLYATYFGGLDFDKIEGATVDNEDNLYIIGMTRSEQGIASPSALQTTINGNADAFIAKLTPLGAVIWSTYYGGPGLEGSNAENADETYIYCGITSDTSNAIYLFTRCGSPDMGTPGTFQPEPQATSRYLISKFTTDGQVSWATYYGINDAEVRAITCTNYELYLAGHSFDCPLPNNTNTPNSYFGTPGTQQPVAYNCRDAFLTKFSTTGSRVWSTYYGGAGTERLTSESIKCGRDYVALAGYTGSTSGLSTPGAFFEGPVQTPQSFLATFNKDGVRNWGTYCGDISSNGGGVFTTFLNIDENDNLYVSGRTLNTQYIATADSFKPNNSGDDAFVVKFSPTGERLWGTYYGGSARDFGLKTLIFENSFYIIGDSSSSDSITTPNALQPNLYISGNDIGYVNNIFIAKFDPTLNTKEIQKNSFSIYPNPNNGTFQISLQNSDSNFTLEIYDTLGHLLQKQSIQNHQTINTTNLSSGIYFANIVTDGISYRTQKIIIK